MSFSDIKAETYNTIREYYLNLLPDFSGVRVARSSVFCAVFFSSLFVLLSFSFGHCIVCHFHLVIVLSVIFIWSLYCLSFFDLRLIISIFKLFYNLIQIKVKEHRFYCWSTFHNHNKGFNDKHNSYIRMSVKWSRIFLSCIISLCNQIKQILILRFVEEQKMLSNEYELFKRDNSNKYIVC